MTITLRGQKGSALTHSELDGNFTDLDGRINSMPSTESMNAAIAAAQTGTAIYRANDTKGVAPTGGEYPSPSEGDDAVVWLNDGVREVWEYAGAAWALRLTLDPHKAGYDYFLGTLGAGGTLANFPAANKGEYVIAVANETVDGQEVRYGQKWRCNVDGTAVSTPANWSVEASQFERPQSELYRWISSGTREGVTVTHMADTDAVRITDDSASLFGSVTFPVPESGGGYVTLQIVLEKRSEKQIAIDTVDRNNFNNFQRVEINPVAGQAVFQHPAQGTFASTPGRTLQIDELPDAWQFTMTMPAPTSVDTGIRIYPALQDLGTPPAGAVHQAHTGSLYVRSIKFLDPRINERTDWQRPTILNGWTTLYGGFVRGAEYRRVGNLVTIRGNVDGGTQLANTVLFTLPEGFRPTASGGDAAAEVFTVQTNGTNGACAITVAENGDVSIGDHSAGSFISLSGISFYVD